MLTWFEVPSDTSTRFATVSPPAQFTFEAVGWLPPVGQTVRKLGAVGSVAGTFRTTVVAPAGRVGPVSSSDPRGLSVPAAVPFPSHWFAATAPPAARVSQIRTGVTGVYGRPDGVVTLTVGDTVRLVNVPPTVDFSVVLKVDGPVLEGAVAPEPPKYWDP